MKKIVMIGFVVVLMAIVRVRAADETAKMPVPQKEHEWLKQLAGEWDLEIAMQEPGKDLVREKGTENVRPLGGFYALTVYTRAAP